MALNDIVTGGRESWITQRFSKYSFSYGEDTLRQNFVMIYVPRAECKFELYGETYSRRGGL